MPGEESKLSCLFCEVLFQLSHLPSLSILIYSSLHLLFHVISNHVYQLWTYDDYTVIHIYSFELFRTLSTTNFRLLPNSYFVFKICLQFLYKREKSLFNFYLLGAVTWFALTISFILKWFSFYIQWTPLGLYWHMKWD